MKQLSRIAVAVAMTIGVGLLAGRSALAQPGGAPGAYPGYYPAAPPPPPPPVYMPAAQGRHGLTLGISVGAGNMMDTNRMLECTSCERNPVAAGARLRIGYMINPRLALLVELGATAKALDAEGTEMLDQYDIGLAAQYWVTQKLWLKGGFGRSELVLQIDNGSFVDEKSLGSGSSLQGAIGYEIFTGRRFALDVAISLASANYQDSLDGAVQTGLFGLGLNWY